MCSCIEGYTGDPFNQCSQQVKPRKYSFSKKISSIGIDQLD